MENKKTEKTKMKKTKIRKIKNGKLKNQKIKNKLLIMISKLVLNIIKAISPRLKSEILNEVIRLILSKAELVYNWVIAPQSHPCDNQYEKGDRAGKNAPPRPF